MSSQSKEEKSSRTYVVNPHDGSCVPFLRGILTSSLQDAGLEFEPAYKLAAHIRRELSNRGEISNTELRNLVAEHLEKEYGDEVRARYVTPLRAPFPIVVHDTQGKADVFSLERLSRALE
nr:hypothetical protein [Anaerolineae bacterium]